MRPFEELGTREAEWSGPVRWRRAWALRVDAEVFATLDWERADGSLVVARTRHGDWTLRRGEGGALRLSLHELESGRRAGAFVGDWRGGGRLTLDSGAAFTWSGAHRWMTRWTLRDGHGHPVLDVRAAPARRVPRALLRLEPGAILRPEVPLLSVVAGCLAAEACDDALLAAGDAPTVTTGRA